MFDDEDDDEHLTTPDALMHMASIVVYCDNPSAHRGRTARLELFTRSASGDWNTYSQRVKPRPGDWGPSRGERNAVTYLDAETDQVMDRVEVYSEGFDVARLRRRFDIECPLCGLKVVAKSETIEPILETFTRHANFDGTPLSLPLRWLAAKISSK